MQIGRNKFNDPEILPVYPNVRKSRVLFQEIFINENRLQPLFRDDSLGK